MNLSLTPPHWPLPFASSPRASSKCQFSTYQIIPDHFFLFAHSNQGQALGLLCQQAAAAWTPRACLSKPLDLVTQGWPPYIQAWLPLQPWYPKRTNSRHVPSQSALHTAFEARCLAGLYAPFPLPGYRLCPPFSLTLNSRSLPVLPLTCQFITHTYSRPDLPLPQWVLPESPSNT